MKVDKDSKEWLEWIWTSFLILILLYWLFPAAERADKNNTSIFREVGFRISETISDFYNGFNDGLHKQEKDSTQQTEIK